MHCKVAVLLLLFNRPAHTQKVLDRLRMVRPPRVYVHCDGPRPERAGEQEKVAAVRAFVKTIDWPCEVFTLYRAQNMGLRMGVTGALNWFFEQEPYGIILEDDCLPDPTFFPFCAELLELYADDPQVMHIGGSNLTERFTCNAAESYVFSRFSFVWGWASWRRAWAKMSLHLEGLDDFEQTPLAQQWLPDSLARYYMLDKFKVTRDGKNNSWAYAWFYSILKNDGLCIVPTFNLVQNTGVGDTDATHTKGKNILAELPARQLSFPLKHPVNRTPDAQLERRFFYDSQKKRLRLWLWRFLRGLSG